MDETFFIKKLIELGGPSLILAALIYFGRPFLKRWLAKIDELIEKVGKLSDSNEKRFNEIERELLVIKTILEVRGIMPQSSPNQKKEPDSNGGHNSKESRTD